MNMGTEARIVNWLYNSRRKSFSVDSAVSAVGGDRETVARACRRVATALGANRTRTSDGKVMYRMSDRITKATADTMKTFNHQTS